jgi:hypothetical protein
MLGLQVLAVACHQDLRMEVVERQRPVLSQAYCVSQPQVEGCKEFLEKPALSLGQLLPINSYQDRATFVTLVYTG